VKLQVLVLKTLCLLAVKIENLATVTVVSTAIVISAVNPAAT
jgi:hypothetical protein